MINWAAVTAVFSILTFVVVLVAGPVLWGKLTEKVEGHDKRLDSHKAEIAAIDKRVGVHDVQIGRLEEWKSGFNAAVSVARHGGEV